MRASTMVRLGMMSLVLVASIVLAKVHADYVGNYDLLSTGRFPWVVLHAGMGLVVGYVAGIPDRMSSTSLAASALIPSLFFTVVQTSVGDFLLPRLFLLASIPVYGAVFFGSSIVSRLVRRSSAERERVVLLCSPESARQVRVDVEYHTEVPCSIVGAIDGAALQDVNDILDEVRRIGPSTVVYSADMSDNHKLNATLIQIHSLGLRVRDLTGFYDEYIGKIPVGELALTAILFDRREIHYPLYSRVSRILDLSFSLFALVILALILPLVWIGNLLGNRGGLFFSQHRVGKEMTQFKIRKLRTMVAGDETHEWTSPDDPRITPFGRLLRVTHLDELPQAWNILRGEIALVGPRPEQPKYVDELLTTIPFYATRHLVKPGLTGWAQVNYPYGSNHNDAYEKLQYDFWYLRHQGLTLDLKIIARTARHVFGSQGR